MQVYKELSILTARPSKKNQKKIKHHLYGFQTVTKKFSSGLWLRLAKLKIKEIQKRNNIPILVGGTGLYFKSLTDGLVKIPNIPIKFRNKIRSMQKNIGQKKFFDKLIKIDPKLKNKIDSNDVQRTIRAFEIKKFTKKSITEWFEKSRLSYKPSNFIKLYIDFPREQLIKRIKKRIDEKLFEGALFEV